jgi:F-type H+-transporting ATPase subunit b
VFLAAEDQPNPLIPHLPEVIVGLVAFALLYYFLSRRAFPLFEKTFRERTERIEGGMRRAEEAQAEASRALEQYRAQLADARGEANHIREEAREQGQAILEELRAQAQEESARITARGEAQLLSERQQVVTSLRGEIGQLAVDLAERIVGTSLAEESRQRAVIDRFLDDLEARAPAGGDGGTPASGAPVSR